MKAITIGFFQYGSTDVFESREIDVHLNALSNVLVKVERIGLNPVDAFIREGNMSGGKPLNGRYTDNFMTSNEVTHSQLSVLLAASVVLSFS